MKKELIINTDQEVLSLVTEITYSTVSDWYDAVYSDLKMDLIIPKHREGHSRQPAILWICGGAFSVVSKTAWIPEMIYFANKGYIIASIEYRTSNKASFPAGLIDVKAAIRYLKANCDKYCINPDQIFVMGESAGGAFASLAGLSSNIKEWDQGSNLHMNSSVAGVVDLYGITDFVNSKLGKSDIVPDWVTIAFLGESNTQENAKRASAVNYVSEEAPPFLILHGTNDETVPIIQSDILYQKLQENNVYSEYYQIRGACHGEDAFYQDDIKNLIYKFLEKIRNNNISEAEIK